MLSNFPKVEDFYPHIDIIHKLALTRERNVDWENLFGGIGAKERVPIATYVKWWSYSLHFASWIGYEVLHGKGWYYIQRSFVKALWQWTSNTASQWPNGSGFYTWLCLIAVRKTGQYKNLIRRMEKIGCVTTIKKVYF